MAAPKDKPTAALPSQRAGQQQEATQAPATALDAAARVVAAYSAALGRPVLGGTRATLHRQAAELLAADLPEAWLADRARELAAHGWTDLARHVERSTVPVPGAAPAAERPERWECVDCRNPYRGAPPADGVCADCHAAAERALRAACAEPSAAEEVSGCPGRGGQSCGRRVVSVTAGLCRHCLAAAEAESRTAAV